MTIETAARLRARLEVDDQVVLGSLRTTTDKELGDRTGRVAVALAAAVTTAAVAGDADLHTTCGALLDALALLEMESGECVTAGDVPSLDLTTINVLVDRPLPGDNPSETDEALAASRCNGWRKSQDLVPTGGDRMDRRRWSCPHVGRG